MNSLPFISVVIPTYNQAEYLRPCLESVLEQTYPFFEVIIINDGSTDETQAILEGFRSHSNIRFFQQSNQGLSAARNSGLERAKGDYIALLDSDDLMLPERLETQLEFLQSNEAIDIVYTAVTLIDEKGNLLSTMRRESIPTENFLAEEFFRNQVPSPSTIMAKQGVFESYPFDSDLRAGEDLEWIIRTAHHHSFQYLDIPLTLYRRHQQNISENLSKLREIELKILQSYGTEHISDCVEKSGIEDKALYKGKILFIMEAYEEAIKILKESSDPLAFFYTGNCFFELKKYHEAAEYYRESLHLSSENPACINNLGAALHNLGHETEAAKKFNEAINLKPGYLDPKFKRFTRRELRKDLLPYTS